jgi:hypothetical protein
MRSSRLSLGAPTRAARTTSRRSSIGSIGENNSATLNKPDNLDRAAQLEQFKQKKQAGGKKGLDTKSKTAGDVESIRKQLHSIYSQQCPEKLEKLDEVMANFAGREDELLKKVRAKYMSKDQEETAQLEKQEKKVAQEQDPAVPTSAKAKVTEEKMTIKAPSKIPTCQAEAPKSCVAAKPPTMLKPPASKVASKVTSSQVPSKAPVKQTQPNKSYRDLKRSEGQLQEELSRLKADMVSLKMKHESEMGDSVRICNSDPRLSLLEEKMAEQEAEMKTKHATDVGDLEGEIARMKKREGNLCHVMETTLAMDSVGVVPIGAIEHTQSFLQAEEAFETDIASMLQNIRSAQQTADRQLEHAQSMVKRLEESEQEDEHEQEQQQEQQQQEEEEEEQQQEEGEQQQEEGEQQHHQHQTEEQPPINHDQVCSLQELVSPELNVEYETVQEQEQEQEQVADDDEDEVAVAVAEAEGGAMIEEKGGVAIAEEDDAGMDEPGMGECPTDNDAADDADVVVDDATDVADVADHIVVGVVGADMDADQQEMAVGVEGVQAAEDVEMDEQVNEEANEEANEEHVEMEAEMSTECERQEGRGDAQLNHPFAAQDNTSADDSFSALEEGAAADDSFLAIELEATADDKFLAISPNDEESEVAKGIDSLFGDEEDDSEGI